MTRDLIIDNYLNEYKQLLYTNNPNEFNINKNIIKEIIHTCLDIFDNQYNNLNLDDVYKKLNIYYNVSYHAFIDIENQIEKYFNNNPIHI
jgi:hypothetical protein